jgi:mono/diheme cytochrome c family protein
MLKKVLKWTGRILLLILFLVIGYYTKAYISTENRRSKVYTIKPLDLNIPTDSVTIAMGKRLVTVKGCDDCHAKDLGGSTIFEKAGMGRLVAKNLTTGEGGLRAGFSTEDWVRAIRHGVQHDGTPLIYMPAGDYNQLSDTDLKAIIAYCAQVPQVNRHHPATEIGPGAVIANDLGALSLFEAEGIDHTLPPPAAKMEQISVEFGQYVALVCTHCHQPNMKGKPGEGGSPDISSTGQSSKWTDEQFFQTLRTGKRPDGSGLKPPMPWQMTSAFSDVEMRALRMYLKSI